MRVGVVCPLCGHVNRITAFWDDVKPHLVLCDCEEGGCDRYFVANMKWEVHVATYKLAPVDTPATYRAEVEA